jgi:acetylornithine/LysW-gamma-L-lysine aminotransferase
MTISTQPDLKTLEQTYSSGAYVKRDLQIVRGAGARIEDVDGNSYIDCVSGMGANNLGHAHPAIVSAIQQQAAEIMVCPELFHNPVRAQYQAALCEAAGMPRVFLCNSGAEAVEGAIKVARAATGRTEIIAAMRGFHGRTLGALSATWNKKYREPFAPLVPDVSHVPFNNIDKLAEAINDSTAAVLLEVVQGEGGVIPAEDGYLQAVRDLCDEHGALLILDEVQTGFGRTGTLFAHAQDGVKPDLLCLAKSMGGGIPMGAVVMGERAGTIPPLTHGSTFGGNPLACAAGLAVLHVLAPPLLASLGIASPSEMERGAVRDHDQIPPSLAGLERGARGVRPSGDLHDVQTGSLQENLISRAGRLGAEGIERLRANVSPQTVRDVRGRGFMIGVELRGKVAPVLHGLQARGVVALPAGLTVLRLLPPLVISDDDFWQVIDTVQEVVSDAV